MTDNKNCDNDNYISETEKASLINSMVLYETSEDGVHYTKHNLMMDNMETKPIFKPDVIAANNERIIIQQKFPLDKTECSICLNTLFHKQVAYLPCKHYFHYACLTMAFNNKLYTCPLCRIDLNNVLNKAGFKFPQADPQQLFDSDLDLIYRILESSVYYPTTIVADASVNIVGDANEYYYQNYSLLDYYYIDFNMDDILRMMDIIDASYNNQFDANVDTTTDVDTDVDTDV